MKTKTRPASVAVPMELIRISQDAARRAAAARLEKLGWTPGEIADAMDNHATAGDTLPNRLHDAYEQALPEATRDFDAAVECRMIDAALHTFAASHVLAGIAAANAFHQAERPARVEHPTDPDGIALHLPDAPSIGIDV
jgi:hypothetical protein